MPINGGSRNGSTLVDALNREKVLETSAFLRIEDKKLLYPSVIKTSVNHSLTIVGRRLCV